MSVLMLAWIGSLLAMGAVFGYGVTFSRRIDAFGHYRRSITPESFSEFFRIETLALIRFLRVRLSLSRPHVVRALIFIGAIIYRGRDMFFERIFGRTEVQRGKAASFFLKRIAEHKEVTRSSNIDRQEAV